MKIWLRVVALGVISGMRTWSGLAIVSRHWTAQRPAAIENSRVRWLANSLTSAILSKLALGELVADKLPFVPARTDPGALAARAVAGASAGASVAIEHDLPPVRGGLLAGTVAVGSAFLFYYLRRGAVERSDAPDFLVALAEDGLVFALGHLAVQE